MCAGRPGRIVSMRTRLLFSALIIVTATGFFSGNRLANVSASCGADRWQLVWSDEFNYKGLPDEAKWGYDVGGHGWGNKELQYYTDGRKENARVENGNLIIEARRDG